MYLFAGQPYVSLTTEAGLVFLTLEGARPTLEYFVNTFASRGSEG